MQPIKALKDELVEFGESLLWQNFEATQAGMLTFGLPRPCLVEGEDAVCYYDFYLRVGLHLGQVMQAIMSCGHFIKLRKENRWLKEHYSALKPLDPAKPMENLFRCYSDPLQQYSPMPAGVKEHWRPDFGGAVTVAPYYWQGVQQAQQTPILGGYAQPYTTHPQYAGYNISSSTTSAPVIVTTTGSTLAIGNTTP